MALITGSRSALERSTDIQHFSNSITQMLTKVNDPSVLGVLCDVSASAVVADYNHTALPAPIVHS